MNTEAEKIIEASQFSVDLGHWQAFNEFAERQGISLEHVDDWKPWFLAFMAGADFEAIRSN